jgi:hypothetical protein
MATQAPCRPGDQRSLALKRFSMTIRHGGILPLPSHRLSSLANTLDFRWKTVDSPR